MKLKNIFSSFISALFQDLKKQTSTKVADKTFKGSSKEADGSEFYEKMSYKDMKKQC